VAHPTTQLQPPPSPEPEEDTPPPTSTGGEEESAGGGQLLSLLAAAAAATAPTPTPTPPQPAPTTNSTAAPAAPAKRARCNLLDELLSQAAAKKAARLAGSAARAAGGVVGTHMVVAQPKRPHGKPASWMMRHDAPALLTLEEFKALSLPALQRLWGEYYVWMGAGERADGSKSGNRSYLQRKLVAA
jgi:pyruvate/2-oxoglutarate dehydrogenase complex dihydrolipoamide acyltransferase (E2) component